MTKREIASLTIKLMGVFILFKAIAYTPAGLSGMYHALQMNSSTGHPLNGGVGFMQTLFVMMVSMMSATIPLAFSLLIIFLSDKAAAWLIKDDRAIENINSSINKDDVMTIAISCIGLYFIIAAVPIFINGFWANQILINRRMGIPAVGPSAMFTLFRTLIAPAVQIGLGVWLFAGSRGIVKLWKKIRS